MSGGHRRRPRDRLKVRSVDAGNRATYRLERPGRHVARDDRIRDTGEPPVPEVNVRATPPTGPCATTLIWFQIGAGEFAYFDRPPRLGHHCRKDAIGHVMRHPLRKPCIRCGSELTTRNDRLMRFHTPERRLSMSVCVCTVAVLLMPSLSTAQTYQVQQRAASSSASASTGCTLPPCTSANTQSRTCSAPRSPQRRCGNELRDS